MGTTAISQPETLPETGADLWLGAIALLGSGAALVGIGGGMRRTRATHLNLRSSAVSPRYETTLWRRK